MVAGVLAYFLAYDTIPFAITNKNLPTEAKKFLKTKASSNRIPDVRAIWNRITEADTPKKQALLAFSLQHKLRQQFSQQRKQLRPSHPQTQAPLATATPIAAYAQGICQIHVNQWNRDGDGNYDLEVLMTDNGDNQIGYTEPLGGADGYTASDPPQFQSKLEDVLTCLPGKEHDYIQFYFGQQGWYSDGDFISGAIPSRSVGGWDRSGEPAQYPVRDCGGEHFFRWLTRRYRNAKWIVHLSVCGEVRSLLTELIEKSIIRSSHAIDCKLFDWGYNFDRLFWEGRHIDRFFGRLDLLTRSLGAMIVDHRTSINPHIRQGLLLPQDILVIRVKSFRDHKDLFLSFMTDQWYIRLPHNGIWTGPK